MRLLGRWNWYLPEWLRWLPRVEVEAVDGHARPADARRPSSPLHKAEEREDLSA
jgi:hypothetical protein